MKTIICAAALALAAAPALAHDAQGAAAATLERLVEVSNA